MELTSSGRNKGLGKANEPKFDCQVCGDLAAGFHCGAYICEACKVSELYANPAVTYVGYDQFVDHDYVCIKKKPSHCTKMHLFIYASMILVLYGKLKGTQYSYSNEKYTIDFFCYMAL